MVFPLRTSYDIEDAKIWNPLSSTLSLLTAGHYPLCSLLVFDASQNAIPVAWVITSCSVGRYINQWMRPLVERIRAKDPRWRPNAFLVDDPSFEPSIIRETFQCRVLLCLWHVRRSWVKGLFKKCSNFDVQCEILKHLGRILYCSRSSPSTLGAVEEFMQIFVDQFAFMDYFKIQWLPRIGIPPHPNSLS